MIPTKDNFRNHPQFAEKTFFLHPHPTKFPHFLSFHIPDLQSNFFANTPNFLFCISLLCIHLENPYVVTLHLLWSSLTLLESIFLPLKQINWTQRRLPDLPPTLVPSMWLLPSVGPVRCCSISVVCFRGLFSWGHTFGWLFYISTLLDLGEKHFRDQQLLYLSMFLSLSEIPPFKRNHTQNHYL